MGVVVLAVAVLPFLGVGGLELITAEAPGTSSDRLTPRVSETARRLWIVYVGFTALAAVALFAADRFSSVYDAVAHALTVASTGGFSPHSDSIGHYGSAAVEVVVIVFMILGGTSFSLHWRAGCTGSTAGGIKVMRMQVLGVVMLRSVRYSQTPRAVIPVRLGRDVISEGVVSRVAGFFLLHVLLVIVGVLVVTALGGDLETSLGGVVSALGNMGPALNEAGPTASFSDAFSQPARLVLAVLMVVGRLEIFPILLAFVPYVDRTRGIARAVRH